MSDKRQREDLRREELRQLYVDSGAFKVTLWGHLIVIVLYLKFMYRKRQQSNDQNSISELLE